MATMELNNKSWKAFSQSDYAVIDCYGDQCVACVILEPVFDAIADELHEISFGRINISHCEDIANAYQIAAMPTLLYFRNGELVGRTAGSMEKEELLKNLSKLLYSDEAFLEDDAL